MKKLLLAIAFHLSLLMNAQTTVFNLGWNGTPETVLCAGDTWIAYSHKSYGPGDDGQLLKFKKVGDEYELLGSIRLPEDLQDYRFVNGNLRLVLFRAFECDFSPHDLYYFEIDTSAFNVANWDIIDSNVNLMQAGFATDSTIFSWTDDIYRYSIIYNVQMGMKSIHGLSDLIGVGYPTDFVKSVFNGEFLFVNSAVLTSYFMVPVVTDSIHLTRAYAAPVGNIT